MIKRASECSKYTVSLGIKGIKLSVDKCNLVPSHSQAHLQPYGRTHTVCVIHTLTYARAHIQSHVRTYSLAHVHARAQSHML